MRLHVLSVAYPLAPVGPGAAGGAEQVLSTTERGLVAAGHRSTVIAAEGSETAGRLVPVPAATAPLTEALRQAATAAVRTRVHAVCRDDPPDIVHFHGLDFPGALPPDGVPAIATVHLPPEWHPEIFRLRRPGLVLAAVSETQRRAFPETTLPVAVLPNGVDVAGLLAVRHARRPFALSLGRICPEKGTADAIDAARRAGLPVIVAGAVFPYAEHVAYFEREVVPRLGRDARFVGPVGPRAKRRLLAAARCLLLPTTAPETSSLVAMEAAACGTPVIAYPSGALPEIVVDGVTGFLADGAEAMAARIAEAGRIDPEECRALARERFGAEALVARTLALYGTLLQARAAA